MREFMYILKCVDDSYYTDSTKKLEFRLYQPQKGEGANHTKKRLPVKSVYFEEFERIDRTFYREKKLQGCSRKKKEALIENNFEKLKEFSKKKFSSIQFASKIIQENSFNHNRKKNVDHSLRNKSQQYKPFIPFTNISDNTYISKNNMGKVVINENDKQNRIEKGDLFFLMSSNDQGEVGKSSVLKDDLVKLYLNTFCKGFKITDKEYDSLFVNYLLSGHSYRELLSIDNLIQKTQKKIEILKEKRNSLINEVVTDKIDVRREKQ